MGHPKQNRRGLTKHEPERFTFGLGRHSRVRPLSADALGRPAVRL